MNNSSSSKKCDRIPLLNSPRAELYDLIRSQVPISLWQLNKLTYLSYSFIKRAIRDFEFCRLIKTRTIINTSGRKEKMIYLEVQDD